MSDGTLLRSCALDGIEPSDEIDVRCSKNGRYIIVRDTRFGRISKSVGMDDPFHDMASTLVLGESDLLPEVQFADQWNVARVFVDTGSEFIMWDRKSHGTFIWPTGSQNALQVPDFDPFGIRPNRLRSRKNACGGIDLNMS